jgi:integrase
MGVVIRSKSAQNTDGSMLRVHVSPMWGCVGISDVRAMAVDKWRKTLTIQTGGEEAGPVGWHSFRHSCRSWIGGGDATMSQQRDMMRHVDIGTTAGYGGTPLEEMRPLVKAAAAKLRPKLRTKRQPELKTLKPTPATP